MDMADHAQTLEAMQRDMALAAHAARGGARASATHCEAAGCGVRIPEARRRAMPGVQHCVECQALIERRARQGGR